MPTALSITPYCISFLSLTISMITVSTIIGCCNFGVFCLERIISSRYYEGSRSKKIAIKLDIVPRRRGTAACRLTVKVTVVGLIPISG